MRPTSDNSLLRIKSLRPSLHTSQMAARPLVGASLHVDSQKCSQTCAQVSLAAAACLSPLHARKCSADAPTATTSASPSKKRSISSRSSTFSARTACALELMLPLQEVSGWPFGPTSSPITLAKLKTGEPIAFIARHGLNHQITPSNVPTRSNIAGALSSALLP